MAGQTFNYQTSVLRPVNDPPVLGSFRCLSRFLAQDGTQTLFYLFVSECLMYVGFLITKLDFLLLICLKSISWTSQDARWVEEGSFLPS